MGGMSAKRKSLWRSWWRQVPLPAAALVIGLLAGFLAWLAIDRQQSAALSEIFEDVLENQLHQVARESLIRFDQHRRSYTYLARLMANHRRMAAYLETTIWPEDGSEYHIYHGSRPPWVPRERIMPGVAQPSHMLLADEQGRIRETYYVTDDPLPASLREDAELQMAVTRRHALLTLIDDEPFLLVAEPLQDDQQAVMGSLVLLVPLDSTFMAAAQQSVASQQSITALMDADAQVVLSSSNPLEIEVGTRIEDLRDQYVLTTQSFSDYEDSDLNMLFATLVPRALYRETGQAILDLQRQQRAIGAGVIVAIFVLLFVLLSARINRSLRRLQDFARRALGEPLAPLESSGNRLIQLEDRIHDVIELVLRARDETRHRHERELRQVEALRIGVMEASVDSIVTVDAEGKVIDFNPTAQKVFSRSLEQAAGKSLSGLVFDEPSGQFFDCLVARLSNDYSDSPVQVELTTLDGEGEHHAMEVVIKPIELDQRLLFTVYLRDIEERKQREAEIRALAAFPEESPNPILRVNRRGVITYANAPSQPLLEYWQCRPLQTLPIYWRDQMEFVLSSGRTQEVELATDGGLFSLLMVPVPDLEYVNIYARDITAQRRAEDALQQRQDELVHVARLSTMGEMSTGIAHELNQPLSAIANFANGCARRLRLDAGGKEELLHALAQISSQAGRAAEIIKRLRNLVTRQHRVREEVDLNQLVSETCALLAHDLRKQQVAVQKRFAARELVVRADTVQIEQALINLLRNALDAMKGLSPLERRLVVTTGISDLGMASISVSDSGAGIHPTDMEHLFDAFFTTKESGMGMGLAITQTIIDDHHGKIHAESWPGKGSTFTIELPLHVETPESLAS
ncbi:MAG: PAS domain S-box protein [Gammaproteobacteria bacterium]|nr:MAG: PAS domain S-box protein [Gammaproteobacteria bacterium]